MRKKLWTMTNWIYYRSFQVNYKYEKKLISLEDFNNFVTRTSKTTKNGIACPVCGEELDDEDPNMMLLCNPPKTAIICFSCGYKGYRSVNT
jgi:hypothetical protein